MNNRKQEIRAKGDRQDKAPTECVIILFSIHYVLKAEQFLKKHRIRHDVVPVPREISSDCGMAIAFQCEHLARVRTVLLEARIDIARIYKKEATGSFLEIPKEKA